VEEAEVQDKGIVEEVATFLSAVVVEATDDLVADLGHLTDVGTFAAGMA